MGRTKIGPKCPDILRTLIEREGSIAGAARACKASNYNLQRIANGDIPMSETMEQKFAAVLEGKAVASRFKSAGKAKEAAPEPEPPKPVEIPEWDGKTTTHKITKKDGKKITVKGLPVELVEVLARNGGVMGTAAKALGVSGWGAIQTALDGDKWGGKMHQRTWCYLNGVPLPKNGNSEYDVPDAHTLGLAICQVAMSEFDRVEELAEVMNGKLVWKTSTGQGWIAIFRIADRSKREQFKRLARRDTKRISCP